MSDGYDEYKLEISDRAYFYIRQFTIKTIDDAMVELITNSQDAYKKKADDINSNVDSVYKNDEITGLNQQLYEIEYGNHTITTDGETRTSTGILLRDKAIGMTGQEMTDKLFKVGQYSVDDAEARGFFSRGAKDISILGDVVFESIKNGKYSKAIIKYDTTCILEHNDIDVTQDIRDKLKLADNGFVVCINLLDIHSDIVYDNLLHDLNYNVYLRDIISDDITNITFAHYDSLDTYETLHRKDTLYYEQYEGKQILNLEFTVPDYPEATAKFVVNLSDIPIPQPNKERQMEFGFITKSENTIHEVSTLQDRFRYHPYINHLFGRLESDYINYLLYDLDQNGPSDKNPTTIIDPSRTYGLNKEHPFVQKLLEIPILRLDFILGNINSQLSGDSVEVSSLDDILVDLEKLGFEYLDEDVVALSWIPDYQAELIKAIEDTREKYVNVENNVTGQMTTLKNTNESIKIQITNYEKSSITEDGSLDIEHYRENNIYVEDENNEIIQINIEELQNNTNDLPSDKTNIDDIFDGDLLVETLTKYIDIERFYDKPFIYQLSTDGELKKLFIYEKGRVDTITTPESDLVVAEKPFLSIEFTKNIHVKKRYIIENRNNSIIIKINLHDNIINDYFTSNTDLSEIDEISDIKQNNALILIQQIITQAFGEIMLINKIKKENILLDSNDEVSKVRKVLDVYEEIMNEIQYPINEIVQKYIKLNSTNNANLINNTNNELLDPLNEIMTDAELGPQISDKYPNFESTVELTKSKLSVLLDKVLKLN